MLGLLLPRGAVTPHAILKPVLTDFSACTEALHICAYVRPETFSINIPSTIGASSAYFGFTGGTGSAYSNEYILDWAYSNSFVSGGINTPLSIPEPATYQLILAGAALLWLRRRQFRLMN